MPEYQRGEGTSQLPQGGASQANASTPSPEQGPDLAPQDPVDIPVEYSGREPVSSEDRSDSENLQLLSGPADANFRPPPGLGVNRVPRRLVRQLPLIAVAQKDPEAPLALRAFYRALVARIEAEQGAED